MDLNGKAVLVTGAGVRVGRAIALAAAKHGANVAIHYNRSAAQAEETAVACRALGVRAAIGQAELSNHGQVRGMVVTLAETLGSLDAVVNSASVFYKTPLDTVTDDHWRENLDVNLLAPWWVIEAALPYMRRAGQGKVVNIADWAGMKPYTGYLPYVVSKAALISLTLALAKELAPLITVNAVAPGPMLPPPDMDAEQILRIAKRIPLERWGSPEDVAAAVMYFLAGSDYSTGAILSVDGGSLIA